jgi:DNA-directed RNA polymerase specialized sigma24 family protein
MNFVQTRARADDPATSKEAAKNAATLTAAAQRRAIALVVSYEPMTAREIAAVTGIDYITVQRRISECGLSKTDCVRDGCHVWTTP